MINSRRVGLAISFLILVSSVLSFSSCKRAHSYDWQAVDLADGQFKVTFPGKPILEESPTKTVTGGSFTLHALRIKPVDTVAYGCAWFDDPSLMGMSAEDRLNQARDNGLRGVQGTLLSEKKTTVQGYPARDIRATARGNAAFDNRIILVGPRLYTLMVGDVTGRHDAANVERFFNSFTPR
jgi:hypothetical protein